jgi:hypothetical protein
LVNVELLGIDIAREGVVKAEGGVGEVGVEDGGPLGNSGAAL